MSAAPTKAGFYWAKWRICDDGTADEAEFVPQTTFEPVIVVNNMEGIEREPLRVLVAGVARSQSLENFFWGDACVRESNGDRI